MAAKWDARDDIFNYPRAGWPKPTKKWYKTLASELDGPNEDGPFPQSKRNGAPSKRPALHQDPNPSLTKKPRRFRDTTGMLPGDTTSSSDEFDDTVDYQTNTRLTQSPHVWNFKTIIQAFNLTPKTYYEAETYLRKLVFNAGLHDLNWKKTGSQNNFLIYPVIDDMIQKYTWLRSADVPWGVQVYGIKGWVQQTAKNMVPRASDQKFDLEKERVVEWYERPAGAPPKPKANDPYPLSLCNIRFHFCSHMFGFNGPPVFVFDHVVSVAALIPRRENGSLDMAKIAWDEIEGKGLIFSLESQMLVYDVEVFGQKIAAKVDSASSMQIALSILHQNLGPWRKDLHFDIYPK